MLSFDVRAEPKSIGSCDQALLVRKESSDGRLRNSEASSCGCESRPIRAMSGRSAVSLAVSPATAGLKRRQASVWAVSSAPKRILFRRAEGFAFPEGRGGRSATGEERRHPAGSWATARKHTDGPATWETPVRPSLKSGRRITRAQGSDAPPVRGDTGGRFRKSLRTKVAVGEGRPSRWRRGRESEGRIRAWIPGNGRSSGAGGAKAAYGMTNARREP